MNNFRQYSQGLILIEVAIAMVIFSLCIGGALMMIQNSQYAQQTQTTQNHRKMILNALNRYHRQLGYLPCPSQPVSDDGFALERCSGPEQQIGILPYKTLGLPAYIAKDGAGHYFTYAISEYASLTLTQHSELRNNINILDKEGRRYASETQDIAFVLISHGPKGNGAFSLQPGRKRFATNSFFENENAKDTLTFYADIPFKDSTNDVFFIQRADLDTPIPSATPASLPPTAVSEENPYGTD
jgi:type II secretory pathway pseudopilin PulG